MALTATITLCRGRYDASGHDDRFPEELPSPFRFFCALVSVAARSGDPASSSALRWLEAQPPPEVLRPAVLDRGREHVFYVTNRVEAGGGSMTHPGRKNGMKHRAWVSFAGEGFTFRWREDPPADVMDELAALASGVTYLGRVESAARVSFGVGDGSGSECADLQRFIQVPLGGSPRSASVAVPYPGLTQQLVDADARGASAWELARWAEYAEPAAGVEGPGEGPFDSMLVFAIPGRPVDGSHVLDLTQAFRSAVISRVSDLTGREHVPSAVHGHEPDVPHLAYVGLPFVGNDHADGGIRGLAVLVPRAVDPAVRATLVRALTAPDSTLDHVRYSRAPKGRLEVEFQHFPTGLHTLREARWTGGEKGSRRWVTATPAMLDRHPRSGVPIEEIVARGIVDAGYPAPRLVEISPAGLVAGAVRLRRGWAQVLGRRPRRPLWHVRVVFEDEVVGPVVFGALRYLGGGLCIPETSPSATSGPGPGEAP